MRDWDITADIEPLDIQPGSVRVPVRAKTTKTA